MMPNKILIMIRKLAGEFEQCWKIHTPKICLHFDHHGFVRLPRTMAFARIYVDY